MAKWQFVEWLLFWILETSHFTFEWDKGNQTKNFVKHKISTNEVEAVFRSGAALPLGIQINPIANEQRFGLIGPCLEGRLLQIAFVFREEKIRVISARPAHKKERKQYEEISRKISKRI